MDGFIDILAVSFFYLYFLGLKFMTPIKQSNPGAAPPSTITLPKTVWKMQGEKKALTSELSTKITVRPIELMCKLRDGSIQ